MNWASKTFNVLTAMGFLIALAVMSPVRAQDANAGRTVESALPTDVSMAHVSVNSKGIAAHGFDVVAFFTEGKAMPGVSTVMATHEGAVYFFANEQNRDIFLTDPASFVPQYGGYDAYCLRLGRKIRVGADMLWKVQDEKLYFFMAEPMLRLWNEAPRENAGVGASIWQRVAHLPDDVLIVKAHKQ